MNPIFNNKKCDLLRSVERELYWQEVEEKIIALKQVLSPCKNRKPKPKKQLERRGAL